MIGSIQSVFLGQQCLLDVYYLETIHKHSQAPPFDIAAAADDDDDGDDDDNNIFDDGENWWWW